jgi:acid phosphatase (class B)
MKRQFQFVLSSVLIALLVISPLLSTALAESDADRIAGIRARIAALEKEIRDFKKDARNLKGLWRIAGKDTLAGTLQGAVLFKRVSGRGKFNFTGSRKYADGQKFGFTGKGKLVRNTFRFEGTITCFQGLADRIEGVLAPGEEQRPTAIQGQYSLSDEGQRLKGTWTAINDATREGGAGSGETGTGETGSGEAGSGETGSGETGTGETGSGETGAARTGTDELSRNRPTRAALEEELKQLRETLAQLLEGVRLDLETDAETYTHPAGGAAAMKVTLAVSNNASAPLTLAFAGGQRYDFLLFDGAGEEVYRWSHGRSFPAGPDTSSPSRLDPGQKHDFKETIELKGKDGKPLPAGKYRLVGILTTRKPLQVETWISCGDGKLTLNGVKRVGFDIDDTLLFSTPAFQKGYESDARPYSKAFWKVVNASDRGNSIPKKKVRRVVKEYLKKGVKVYAITARKPHGGAKLKKFIHEVFGIPEENIYFEPVSKVKRILDLKLDAFYGDSDSDMEAALAAGIKAIRVERSAKSSYKKKYHPGKYGEPVLDNSAE